MTSAQLPTELTYPPTQLHPSAGPPHQQQDPQLQQLVKQKSELILSRLTDTERRFFALLLAFSQHHQQQQQQHALPNGDSDSNAVHNADGTSVNLSSTHVRVAGGWVRDKLLGQTTHDIDLVTDRVGGVAFANALRDWLLSVGEPASSIGVINSNPSQSKHLDTATFRYSNIDLDINHFRKESYAQTSRIPTVEPGTATEDAERRDFTINALFFNVQTGEVEDWSNRGLIDFEKHLIATPLPALQTFRDDPLRVLRAARFAGRLNWTVDNDISEAARSAIVHDDILLKVSRERIGIEIGKMLAKPETMRPSLALLYSWKLHDVIVHIPQPKDAIKIVGDDEQIALAASILDFPLDSLYDSKIAELCERQLLVANHYCYTDNQAVDPSYSQIPEVDRGLTLLAALLLPYYGYDAHIPKKTSTTVIPLSEHVVLESLKQPARSAQFVKTVISGAYRLVKLSELCKPDASQQSDALILCCGSILEKDTKAYSHAALFLANVLMCNHHTLPSNAYLNWLRNDSHLMTPGSEIWEWQPYIRGKEYSQWNTQNKVPKTTEGGALKQHLLKYRMLNPHTTEADFRQWLDTTIAELKAGQQPTNGTHEPDTTWSLNTFRSWLRQYVAPTSS